jgi:hypothetical protein
MTRDAQEYPAFLISGIRIPDWTMRISGRMPDTENIRVSSQIEEITISIHKISNANCFDEKILSFNYGKRKT